MKKKWIGIIMAGAVAVSVAGCSGELSDDYVTIKQYKKLEITQIEEIEITDEMVESRIKSYLAVSQEEEDITDRPAEIGDMVNIDYVGTIGGVEFEGGSATSLNLELGGGQFLQAEGDYAGFEDQIAGHETGENFDIAVKFPDDYNGEEVAGQVANFNITLNRIYQVKEAELTDEWVQENSEESKTVEEFKEEVRKNAETSSEQQREVSLRNAVMDAFLEQVDVKKLPKDQVEEEYKAIEENYKKIAADGYGLEFEEFLGQYMQMTKGEFEEQAQEAAELAVKRRLACRLLADKKNLELSDKEYEEKLKEYAEESGYEDVNAYKEQVGEEIIRDAALQEKVADYMVKSCIQVERQETEEDAADTNEETAQ